MRMDSGVIIALLAVFTIGIVLAISIFHFGYFLKDPRNRGAARNVINDGESATTRVRPNSTTSGAFAGLAEQHEHDAADTVHASSGVMPSRAGAQPPGL
jgi:hypothetical protein